MCVTSGAAVFAAGSLLRRGRRTPHSFVDGHKHVGRSARREETGGLRFLRRPAGLQARHRDLPPAALAMRRSGVPAGPRR